MKKILAMLLTFTLLLQACAGTQKPSALQNYEDQFQPLPIPTEESLEQLEVVEIPTRSENPDPNAFTVRLLANQTAPFAGLLLSDSAAAFVVTEYQALTERFVLTLGLQRQKAQARLLRDNQRLTLQINGERERFIVAIRSQQQQIIDLRTLNAEANSVWPKVWIGLGSLGVGLIVGLVVGLVAAK
jgi:hypothetical protein